MKKSVILIVLVAMQLMVLLVMAGLRYYTKENGTNLILLTEPVDLKQMVYEDTVYLTYDAQRIPWSKWEGKARLKDGEAIYVLFEKNGNIYEPARVSREKMKGVVLRAKYQYDDTGFMHVTYGMERYRFSPNTKIESGERKWHVYIKTSPYHQFVTQILP
ncbi:GDYXXLXY domain-containing protein [Ectobacillus sp. JY-23]|uniref:GDYXXLXY domain-containing protein n=1 Tax=Ectobacillus sp. JY-23 TaxID=2933872 RepID=UPI001FF43E42|nr:GDYXXLXY domain-containing protein [Ectobacillus sp. JY-23]UOY93410.1 GDYXXLXY domain-containing protein [Ectobacillus sp. JY-23]